MRHEDYLQALPTLPNRGSETPSLECLSSPTEPQPLPARVRKSYRWSSGTENTWTEAPLLGCWVWAPILAEQRPRTPILLGAGRHPHGQRCNMRKNGISPKCGGISSSSGHREGVAGQGSQWQGHCGTHRGPRARRGWGLGVVGVRRHAQVRRATYTYGVVPQDVQLLHQLCDQDVLEAKTRGTNGR